MGITFNFDMHAALQMLFYILIFFFMVYALFLGHHWFTYGENRRISTIAMATYLGGGAILFIIFATSLQMT
jgi:hypothetical protein